MNGLQTVRSAGGQACQRAVQHGVPGLLCGFGADSAPEQGPGRGDAGGDWAQERETWPGQRVGIRAPKAGETPLSDAEVLVALGGDGAMYDIGFQNLSRMMMSGKPIKVVIVDTQVYSNTGGQASMATPMPPLAWWSAETSGFDAVGEHNLLRVANQVAAGLGLPQATSVAQLLAADDGLQHDAHRPTPSGTTSWPKASWSPYATRESPDPEIAITLLPDAGGTGMALLEVRGNGCGIHLSCSNANAAALWSDFQRTRCSGSFCRGTASSRIWIDGRGETQRFNASGERSLATDYHASCQDA